MKSGNFLNLQKEYFNKNKGIYDISKIFNPPVHTRLETDRLIGLIPKNIKSVVDFGSGNGRLTIPLLKKGFKVTAVDISEGSLERLKDVCRKLNYRVDTKMNLEKVSKVHVVVGCDILHHVDLQYELNRIYNKLYFGGVIVFSEPNVLNPAWYLYIILKGILKYEKNIIYINYFNLMRIFQESGYKNIQIKGLGLFPRVLMQNEKFCKLNDRLGNLPFIKLFAYRYIIVAKK